jgi:mono/diheme cytochrome c family protein
LRGCAPGHAIRHPHLVRVTADAGWITLRGSVLSGESEKLVDAVRQVSGVQGVDAHLNEPGWIYTGAWFAGQVNNWDEAAFEVREARGVLQAGSARSSAARQQALLACNDAFMTPLATAAQSGDPVQYQQAYRTAIQACNACHSAQAYGPNGGTLSFYPRPGSDFVDLGRVCVCEIGGLVTWLTHYVSSAAAAALTVGRLLVGAGLVPTSGSAQSQQSSAQPAASPAPTPLSLETLTQIQPGLSTYMMETAQRFGIMWLPAQQKNWDLAAFEAREAEQVLQHGAVRSNQSRQMGINGVNSTFVVPLIAAAQSDDQAQFESAYTRAISGCNACHATQTYGQKNRPFSFVKIQVPRTSPEDISAYSPHLIGWDVTYHGGRRRPPRSVGSSGQWVPTLVSCCEYVGSFQLSCSR